MFQRTKICSGLLIAFGSSLLTATPGAFAQDNVQRVEITGSAIKRIDAETSVPVTILKADDLKKQGITTVEQILQNVSAVQVQQGTSQVVGSSSGGASFADLRGLGANKTLVLLNGRRIANNAFDSSAPDLNMIPFAAIERVEVLQDSASSLYGTDAIAGVLNFITRKDYHGGTITVGLDSPQHPGGAAHSANLGLGLGDFQKDGFNVFGFVDFHKQAAITSTQRNFSHKKIVGPSGTTFPGTYTAATTTQAVDKNNNPLFLADPVTGLPTTTPQYSTVTYTPFAAPDCPASQHLYVRGAPNQCGEVTSDFVNYTPKSERISGLLKTSIKLTDNHTLGLEGFVSQNRVVSDIAPVPYGALYIDPTSPYYPGKIAGTVPAGVTLLPAGDAQQGDIFVKYRDTFNGYREDIGTNIQTRFVASLEGNLLDWDYSLGAALNNNKTQDFLSHGYSNIDIIAPADADGNNILDNRINPFGAQTPAGAALLSSAVKNGILQSAQGTVQSLDGHASHDLGDWFKAGRATAVAVGFEARHERFLQAANTQYAQQVVASTGIDPNTFNAGHRNVYAGFVQLSVPVLKSLDVDVAARYDKYSDFGHTTNPKVSFRFQPVKQFLLRGSYSTGFRAPSLYELNAAPTYGNTSTVDDFKYCTIGTNADGGATYTPAPGHPQACQAQFEALSGGNKNLKPEKSKSATLGIVLEPVNDLSLGFDFFNIKTRDTIAALADTTVFTDPATYPGVFHRNGADDFSVDGTQCPGANCGYIDLRTQNLGGTNTNGVDISALYSANAGAVGRFGFDVHSTYIHKFEYQNNAGGAWIQNVGVYSGLNPVFRWQHNATVTWNLDPFSLGLAGHYKTGYVDQSGDRRVGSYATFDLYGSYAAPKGFGFTVGVRNLLDRDPPYSDQGQEFQGGYDPRFADPTGRTYYARGTYSF